MNQENVLDYLRKTPHNTNVNVVKGMIGGTGDSLPEVTEADNGMVLTVVDGQWDKAENGSDVGYECTETKTLLTEESVTTVVGENGNEGNLAYSTPITADTIKVTFNGVEYTCQRRAAILDVSDYGAPSAPEGYDFSEFPFNLFSRDANNNNHLVTETAGTYQVKIEAVEESVETSECFEKAVKEVGGGTLVVRVDHTEGTFPNVNTIYDKTWEEVNDALTRGERVVIVASTNVPFDSATQAIILRTLGGDPLMAFGVDTLGSAVNQTSYYARSKDSYLQTQEIQQEEEEQP